jgi:hypothetical protein
MTNKSVGKLQSGRVSSSQDVYDRNAQRVQLETKKYRPGQEAAEKWG